MIKSRYIFLGLAMILMLAGCGANRKTIRFGAAGIGGMYDSFANAYVSLANKEDFSYKLETRNTAGSAANVRLLSGKYIELGIAQADLVEEAYHGTGEFRDKAYQGYKAVAALYPEACQIIVRTDSEIETLDDLLGKTISIGAEESGTERNANQILQAQGISGDMVKTVNLDYTEAAAKLADGEIDAFLSDITQSYASLFTVCFTVSRYYEKYTGAMPSENEIAFIALQVGGALHRNPMTVRAVLIGAAGYATGSIIAGKIENRVPDVRIVSILSSDRIEHIDEYDCDLILSTIDTQADIHKDMRFLYVSPLISAQDEKNIRNKCFELMTGQSAEVSEFSQMLSEEFIIFEKKAKKRKDVLKRACQLLINKGIVQSEFARDVLEREKVEATAVGCNIAIPHGKPEHVNRCQILVIRLDKPIEWGERMADMIFLLAINFDSVNTTKAFFHDFTKLLNENGATDRLREAASPHELCAAIRKELGWN